MVLWARLSFEFCGDAKQNNVNQLILDHWVDDNRCQPAKIDALHSYLSADATALSRKLVFCVCLE